MSSPRKYRCPYCKKTYTRDNMPPHLERNHMDMLPEGFTPLRATFHIVNNKPYTYTRPCRICHGPTDWDEKKGRYNFLCNKKSCHDAWVKQMQITMGDKMGSNRATATEEGLEKMLAARKISGKYTFQDGGVKTYVGSYEKETLKFMDEVMGIKSEDLMTPGPALEYMYEGKKHYYIPDMLYIPYNLIIEVKDGGKNPNNNQAMKEVRAKSIAKEEFIIKNTNYNYLRLTDKDFSQLLYAFADLKMHLVDKDDQRVIHVNEAAENIWNDTKDITNEITNLICEITKRDLDRNKVLSPIFIINTYTGTAMGHVMKDFLNMTYSHALIATDPSLKTMYSYDRVGLHVDSIDNYIKANDGVMRVIAVFVSPKTKSTISKSLKYYVANKGKTHYSIIGLFDLLNGSNKIKSYGDFTLFCSEFVDSILKNANIDITGKSSRNTAPDDFGKYNAKNNVFKLYEGSIKKYKPGKVSALIKKLKNTKDYDKLRANTMGSPNNINLGKKNYWPAIGKNTLHMIAPHVSNSTDKNSKKPVQEEVGGIPYNCGTMNGVIVTNYLKNNVFAKSNYGIADSYELNNIVTVAANKVLQRESADFLDNTRYTAYFVECDRKKVMETLANNMNKPVPNNFIYETVFGHTPYTVDQIKFEQGVTPINDYYHNIQNIKNVMEDYIYYGITPEVEEDKQILSKTFVKSDDGVLNCSLYLRGYDKPFRGRSSMIILRKMEDNVWYGLFDLTNKKQIIVPGGGWNPNETPMEAAIREAKEEVHIDVTDVAYEGIKLEYHDEVADWVKQHVPNKDEWWYGYYSRIFVGQYKSEFTGTVKTIDLDPIEDRALWYPVDKILTNPALPIEYANAIRNYLSTQKPNNDISDVNEGYIVNNKDIYYNKDKFDSGEINLCFITGLSGSGKTTLSSDIKDKNIEVIHLDDIFCAKDEYTLSQIKKISELAYSFFQGVGKKYYITYDELKKKDEFKDHYEDILCQDLVHYAMKYAKAHKDKKYIIEGIWLYECSNGKYWFDPSEFKDYAFYIKGTSVLLSHLRAAKRDSSDGETKIDKIKAFVNIASRNWGYYNNSEKYIKRFRDYFSKLIKEQNKKEKISEEYIDNFSNKKQYLSESNTTAKSDNTVSDNPEELSSWMKRNIKYANFTKLKSHDEVLKTRCGSCHDQVMFELTELKNYHPKAEFLIEYNDSESSNAVTHSFVYYEKDGKTYYFENAWGGHAGIKQMNLEEIKDYFIKAHKKGEFGNYNRYPNIQFTPFGHHEPGESLGEFVNKCVGNIKESTDLNEYMVESVSRDTSKTKDIQTIIDSLSASDKAKLDMPKVYKYDDSHTVKEIVKYVNSEPVAYFAIDLFKTKEIGVSLATRTGYQGKGYGSIVAKEGTAWIKAHKQDFTIAYWPTKAFNKSSQLLAEKNGWKVVRNDNEWKTYAIEGSLKKSTNEAVINNNEFKILEKDKASLKNYNMIIIGEIHSRSMIPIYDKLLTDFKPEYFICEFADQDECLNDKELKDRMDHATDGSYELKNGADYQYNYWCYELALKHHCKLIGCNPLSDTKFSNMDAEDKFREAYMLKVIKKYEHKRCIVQLGDHHLRSIPITSEFIKFCGDENKDDRGIVNDIRTSNASPVFEYFKDKNNVLIVRVYNEYKNESDFMKSYQKNSIAESPINKFKRIPLTESNLNRYKSQYRNLSHIRINDNTNGFIYLDDDKVIAIISVETKDDGVWIQGLEIFGDYKGTGLSYSLLDTAVKELHADHLSVRKTNTIAKKLYDKYGFKVYKQDDYMYYMIYK